MTTYTNTTWHVSFVDDKTGRETAVTVEALDEWEAMRKAALKADAHNTLRCNSVTRD